MSNKRGRPRKFNSVEEMQQAIDEYFSKCDSVTRTVLVGKPPMPMNISDPDPYTVEGLAKALEVDRHTLLHYEKNPEYSEYFTTVKNAKIRIQENTVIRALKGNSNPAVSIFVMRNNFGYEDTQRFDITTAKVVKNLSKEQIAEIISDE